MISFCHKYHITLGHSTTYYPQGNGLAESSNKSLINIIKNVLEENKKNLHKKLVNALWADRLTTKRSIGTSPYELVYGMEARFPSSLGIPVIKLLQEIQAEPNDVKRRINQTIHLQQTREEVYHRNQVLQEKLKKMFDKRTKAEDFFIGNKVLRWDSRREDKGKHGKFDFLWKGPFVIQVVQGNNTYFLKSLDGTEAKDGTVNGRMIKHYFDPFLMYITQIYICTLIFVFSAFLQQSDEEIMQQIFKEGSKKCTILISVLKLSQKCLGKYEYVDEHSEGKKQSCNFTAIQLKKVVAHRLQRFNQ